MIKINSGMFHIDELREEKTSHLGINPRRGGRPPRDISISVRQIKRGGLELNSARVIDGDKCL